MKGALLLMALSYIKTAMKTIYWTNRLKLTAIIKKNSPVQHPFPHTISQALLSLTFLSRV